MKQTETNEFVAQGAATWQEREEHDRIMKALDNVRGFVDSYFYINGNCYYWSTKPLPEEEALAIAQRGRHDEIMYMIHQYGRAKCPGDQQQHLHHVHTCLLPQSVQVIIARRNNREEMDAFLLYNGFEELGQDIVLDREDHEEIMRYVDRHGFKLKQQRRLKQRGNKDEIGLHIARHGLADELLDEMFDEIAAGGSLDGYYQFIERNQFRPAYQRRMLQTVGTDAFKAYADRYGLWEEVHGDLNNIYETTLKSIDPGLTLLTNNEYTEVVGSDEAIYYYGRLVVPNDRGVLRIGMTTQNVIYEDSAEDVLTVPATAIKNEGQGKFVEILTKNGVEKRSVVTGVSDGLNIEVKSGVKEGEEAVLAKMSSAEISDKTSKIRGPRGF